MGGCDRALTARWVWGWWVRCVMVRRMGGVGEDLMDREHVDGQIQQANQDASQDAGSDTQQKKLPEDVPPPEQEAFAGGVVARVMGRGRVWWRGVFGGRGFTKWVDRAVRYGLLGVLVVGPLLMGGVHYEAGFGLSAVGVFLGVMAWVAHGGKLAGGPIGVALLLWVVVTAVQVLPLPPGLVEALQPETAAHHAAARALLGESSGEGMTLSLSPNRTAMALWHALGVLGVFVAAVLSLQTWKRFAWFVPRLLVVGVVFGIAAVAQTVLFDGTVLGMMKPEAELATLWQGLLKTTLVCSNHAASLLGVMSALAMGVALSQQDAGRKGLMLTLYGALALGMCLTLSRGGILAWACSHALLWLMLRGHTSNKRRGTMWAVVVAVAITGAVVFWMGDRYLRNVWDQTVTEWQRVDTQSVDSRSVRAAADTTPTASATQPPRVLDALDAEPLGEPSTPTKTDAAYADRWLEPSTPASAEASKILIYRDIAPMLSDYKMVGIGRGAFVEVYPLYAGVRSPKTYSSAENEYLEFAAEYGLLIAAVFFGLMAWGGGRILVRDWREQDRPLIAGLLMAVGLVAVHNIVDFNLRVPALGQLMAVMLGALVARDSRYRAVLSKKTPAEAAIWGRLAMAAGFVGALLVGLAHLTEAEKGATSQDVHALQQQVEALLKQKDPTANANTDTNTHTHKTLLTAAQEVVRARPADGYASFLVGVGLASGPDLAKPDALIWLDRAKRLHHFDYRIELARGSVLGALGKPDEAAAAFKAAAELDRGSMYAITAAIARTFTDMDHLVASLSSSPADWLHLGKVLLDTQRYEEAVELAQRLTAAHPNEPAGLTLAYQAALKLGFVEAALGAANTLVETFGDNPESYLMLYSAQLRQRPANIEGAYATLIEALKRHPKNTLLLQYQAQFLLGIGQKLFPTPDDLPRWQQAIDEVMDAWRPAALANHQTRPGFYYLRGEYYRKLNNPKQALQAYQAALSAQPEHTASLAARFDVALRLSDLDLAFKSLKDLSGHLPSSTLDAMRQRLERCRAILQRGQQLDFAPDGQCRSASSSAAGLRQKITEQQILNPP